MTKPHILIVDDDVQIQKMLKKRFDGDYEISTASFQDEAFIALTTGQFDLVLLDLKMPRDKEDMEPSASVGADILRYILEKKICRRGTKDQIPVVIMTAFGSETVFPAEVFGRDGACDYVQKPFGKNNALNRKIELALCGEGTFAAPSKRTVNVVQLRFNDADKSVLIEHFSYSGAAYDLLNVLRQLFLSDLYALKAHDSYAKIRAPMFADKLGIEEASLRQRIAAFRTQVAKEFREHLRRELDDNDIIENSRDGNGYRLNPLVVKPVAWEQEMTAIAPRTK